VLRGRGTEGSLRQVAAQFGELLRVGQIASMRSAHGNSLDVLAAKHRAAAAASGMPPVVRDRRVADEALAGRPDRRNPVVGAEPGPHLLVFQRTTVDPKLLP